MRTLSARLSSGVIYVCVLFAVVAGGIGTAGIIGVGWATDTGNSIIRDELTTATATAQFSQKLDIAYASGQALATTTDPARRTQITDDLYGRLVPATDFALAALQRVHADDDPTEAAGITALAGEWTTLRNLLSPTATGSPTDAPDPVVARLGTAYAPLASRVAALIAREDADGNADQVHARAVSTVTRWGIAGTVVLAILAMIGSGWVVTRRLRRALEPGQDQIEFANTLQLAEDEQEAHQLLQRHLQRTVARSTVTVLNRNNSADRLEAVTAVPSASALITTLAYAEPRSCLAVRSGRSHDEDAERTALLSCAVCSECPGNSTCTPLTVGGEVIGSVLVNRPERYDPVERQHIRDSVGQAAPVVANLRNLAIAEIRAATDSLTGLPNKRSVGDTLKRMLAQGSRNFTPVSLLLLDLDHFKEINDRYGHPVGDQALASVGAALNSALRDSDFAGRAGGEEFAVILPDTDSDGATLTAEKIRAAIAEISLPGLDLTITASVGIATYPSHATTTERLERLADSALYVAKRSGRDRIEIAAPGADAVMPPMVDVQNRH